MKENTKSLRERLGEETIYLQNEMEDAVLKMVPGQGWFIKIAGSPEVKAVEGSTVVADTLLMKQEITAKEYKDFAVNNGRG